MLIGCGMLAQGGIGLSEGRGDPPSMAHGPAAESTRSGRAQARSAAGSLPRRPSPSAMDPSARDSAREESTSRGSAHEEPSNSDEVGGRYAKYVLGVLVVVYVFNFVDRQILSILAEDIKADLSLSDAQIGFLYGTAFAVFYAVFGIALGRLADLWVRKSLIAIGLTFWSVMTALSGTARSFASLAVFRFGVGIGEASATPAAFSILSDYFPARVRATVLAIYSSGVYIGAGVG